MTIETSSSLTFTVEYHKVKYKHFYNHNLYNIHRYTLKITILAQSVDNIQFAVILAGSI